MKQRDYEPTVPDEEFLRESNRNARALAREIGRQPDEETEDLFYFPTSQRYSVKKDAQEPKTVQKG